MYTAALLRVASRAAASRAAAPTAVMGAPVGASEPSLSSLPVRDARSPVRDRVALLLMSSLSSLSDVCIGGARGVAPVSWRVFFGLYSDLSTRGSWRVCVPLVSVWCTCVCVEFTLVCMTRNDAPLRFHDYV